MNMNETEMKDAMVELFADALERVGKARRELMQDTVPPTPLPRFRYFRLTGSGWYVEYPASNERGEPWYETIRVVRRSSSHTVNLYSNAPANLKRFVDMVGYSPASIVRLVRWLESIERWMLARAEGRRRHAQEILRQQQHATDEFERMLTALKLRRSP